MTGCILSYLSYTIMKKNSFAILTIILTFPCLVLSQNKISGNIRTEITPPIIVEEKEKLGFGTFTVNDRGGIIRLSAESERIADGDIRLLDSPYSAGKFSIISSPGSLITIIIPRNTLTLPIAENTKRIILNNFTTNLPDCGVLTCRQNGILEVNIGATLHVEKVTEIKKSSNENKRSYEIVFLYN